MKVALVQAQLQQAAAARNREYLAAAMDECGHGVDLYVLPETFATGFLGDGERTPEAMDGESVRWMQHQAQARKAAVCGSLVIGDAGRRYNRLVYVDRTGDVIGHYDKRHLFGYGGENRRYSAGDRRVVLNTAGWRLCLQICYDLRFPVWCRYRNDYDVLLFVANWPIKRVAAWQHLLCARAIENQCYVIGVNRAGSDGSDMTYGGCSAIYGPLGETIVELGHEPGVARGVLERQRLSEIRESLPFLADADGFEFTDLGG